MSERFFFDTDEEAQQAADALRCLGAQARQLLAECIEHQGVQRKRVSAAARALENAGFVFIRGEEKIFSEDSITINPSLAGEEAMIFMDYRKGKMS